MLRGSPNSLHHHRSHKEWGIHMARFGTENLCGKERPHEFLVMPFGLTDAPATFQSCMNHTFRAQLRKYLLVFFDDILIYNKTWEEHLKHLDEVLRILEEHSLYAKMSKCEFGMKEMLYLGHIIKAEGV